MFGHPNAPFENSYLLGSSFCFIEESRRSLRRLLYRSGSRVDPLVEEEPPNGIQLHAYGGCPTNASDASLLTRKEYPQKQYLKSLGAQHRSQARRKNSMA